MAQGGGVRLSKRGGRLRAAIRARGRALDLGEAGLQPLGLAGPSRSDPGGHGLRTGDLLAGGGWLVGGSHRRATGGNERWLRGHHTLPSRRADGGGHALLYGHRAAKPRFIIARGSPKNLALFLRSHPERKFNHCLPWLGSGG